MNKVKHLVYAVVGGALGVIVCGAWFFVPWWFGGASPAIPHLPHAAKPAPTRTPLQQLNDDPRVNQSWKDAANQAAAHCSNVWLEHGPTQVAIQGIPVPETTPNTDNSRTELMASGCDGGTDVRDIGGVRSSAD